MHLIVRPTRILMQIPNKNIARSQNAALSTSQVESRCEIVLTKILVFKVLQQFEFLSFVTIIILSKFDLLSFVTILVFEFFHILSF